MTLPEGGMEAAAAGPHGWRRWGLPSHRRCCPAPRHPRRPCLPHSRRRRTLSPLPEHPPVHSPRAHRRRQCPRTPRPPLHRSPVDRLPLHRPCSRPRRMARVRARIAANPAAPPAGTGGSSQPRWPTTRARRGGEERVAVK
eukprot:scaffold22580_cov91-Isochrysis_galbana.AAC.2